MKHKYLFLLGLFLSVINENRSFSLSLKVAQIMFYFLHIKIYFTKSPVLPPVSLSSSSFQLVFSFLPALQFVCIQMLGLLSRENTCRDPKKGHLSSFVKQSRPVALPKSFISELELNEMSFIFVVLLLEC